MPNESTPFPTSGPDGVGDAAVHADPGAALGDAARERASDHADDLIERIARSAHETIDRLAASAAPHVSRLQEGLSGEAWHERADQARELRDEWTESLRVTVRANPLAAVGVAVAVGVLIARLSR